MDLTASESKEAQASVDDPLTDHAYDGIQEYDNPLPRWWVWLFWGSFYFALFYIIYYDLTDNGPSVLASYEEDMRVFREKQALEAMGTEITEESLQKLSSDAALMKDAKTTFTRYCVQCHAQGEGNIGPNLTDSYWLHGDGSALAIYETVKAGVTSKGMPAWERQLRPVELGKVAAYVFTLRGLNLPGKAPQGKLVVAPTPSPPEPAGGSAQAPADDEAHEPTEAAEQPADPSSPSTTPAHIEE